MQPITYRKKFIVSPRDPVLVGFGFLFVAALWAAMPLLFPLLSGWIKGAPRDYGSVKTVYAMILALLHVSLAVYIFRLGSPKRNFLLLDQEGLTYTRERRSHRWPWRGLSAFDIDEAQRGRHRIEFSFPDTGVLSREVPGYSRTTKAGAVVAIEDAYGTPLDEIAAKLNEYRERALDGGVGQPEAQG